MVVAVTTFVVRSRAKATKGLLGLVPSAGSGSDSVAPPSRAQPADHTATVVHRYSRRRRREMGRSAKVARIGNFATHKKNVQKRSLVVEKRPKKSRQTYATSKAPARAPKKAVRDAPKKK